MIRTRFALLASLVLALCLSGCTSEDPGQMSAKPVIYLYPEEETEITVTLDYAGELTCVYPAMDDSSSWTVTAAPDGTLTDAQGQTYNYLYWEGVTHADYDFSSGFCVAGADTAAFLEDALAQLGLTRREANEFIVYWLPPDGIQPLQFDCLPARRLYQPRRALHYTGAGEFAAGLYGLESPGCPCGPSRPDAAAR